ncbi:hypothetical protein [Rufibacter hautae]|uniref:Uncharacterized protein n=1 Tax=Rufibacter hautae TaxID=2595005 RepID=A0A5B6TGT2_9BACT|nr:hypothetical protein [Rufibacter hautae]KAA3438464.1 hypothetical protein FOA19_14610 [Rufibacter hautae]
MSKEELLERARLWLQIPYPKNRATANIQELNILFNAITGRNVDCTSCNFNAMASELQRYTLNPDSIIVYPTQQEIMANKTTKYQISKAAKANNVGTVVLVHDNGATEAITLASMTDEQADGIANSEQFKHNVELVNHSSDEDDAPKLTEKQKLQAQYEELSGEKPDGKLTIAQLELKITELEELGNKENGGE